LNFIHFSPHFPPNYSHFTEQLHQLGVNVLGIADEPFDHLSYELKESLTEYYFVNDMKNYDEVVRACGYFTHKYGKLDAVESFNEYWLESDARLRTDFNIPGIKTDKILQIKRKSLMKPVFKKAGVPVAHGKVTATLAEAKRLVSETSFPLVAKPDIGVGAAKTYKIHSMSQLEDFFLQKPDIDYILEEYIAGEIVTFDGLTDQDGNPVFYTSHQYSQGIMEVVIGDTDVFYYSMRQIPADLEEMGRRVLRAFDVRSRFFHFEFFRRSDDQSIIALEVNIRPPGGWTTEMFNFANDIDIYKEYANIVLHNQFTTEYHRPYHACYVGRKFKFNYHHPHQEILEAFGGNQLCFHQAISGVFSSALGDYGYLIRSPELDEIFAIAGFIQSKVQE
jgi:biotin carboxylase